MSEAVQSFAARARTERAWWVAAALVAVGVIYPFIVDMLQDLPLIGDFVPRTGSMVIMVTFTMMALGLNVVVGYAGLLDLGYVAFYAAGAYVAGWFASLQFEQISWHFLSGAADGQVGIHISVWLVLAARRRVHASRRASSSACRRFGCGGTTSRS